MSYKNEYLEYLRVVKHYSDYTINSYDCDIDDFLRFNRQKIVISKDDAYQYLETIYKYNYQASTVSRKLSALRGFYQYLMKKNIVTDNYFRGIKNPKGSRSLPKYVKENDMDKIFAVLKPRNAYEYRNALIVRMLYATGVRVSELCHIKMNDIDMKERTIRIVGKGSKTRIVVFGYHTLDALEEYLDNGRGILDKKNSEYLFLNKDGGVLSTRYVRRIIDDVILRAGVVMHVSPHMLRHTFATSMLNNGIDLVSVKDLLGHSNLNTTSIYTHISNERLREVYNKSHPRA